MFIIALVNYGISYVQEMQSLVSTVGAEVNFDQTSYSNEVMIWSHTVYKAILYTDTTQNPYLVVQLESEATAKHVLSRSLLMK